MAIAKVRTQLNLDRYAKIMGITPLLFNGASPVELSSGAVLFPMDNAQNDVWPQYEWQNFDMVSREGLAREIAQCESEIGDFFGYHFSPVWIEKERHDLSMHYRPELRYAAMDWDVSGQHSSLQTMYKHFIHGGRRKSELIDSDVVVSYMDNDLDGFDELAVITVAIPSTITDYSEVKVYFADHYGDPTYEIREFKTKTYSAPNLIFVFYTWQMINPTMLDAFPTSNGNVGVDMSALSALVSTVDVYREYNDPTQDHVVFYEESRLDGAITETGGFLTRSFEDGKVYPVPGEYDTTTGAWAGATATCISPQYADLWYYAGMRNRPGKHPYSDDYLPDDVAMAIAYMATARLEKIFYANNNATALAASLRENMNEGSQGVFKVMPIDVTQNPFGVKKGEWLAWRMLYRYKPLRKTGGAL